MRTYFIPIVGLILSMVLVGCGGGAKTIDLPERWTNSMGLEFVLVPPGSFSMGANVKEERPAHTVTLTRPYYFARGHVSRRIMKVYRAETGNDDPRWELDPKEREKNWIDHPPYYENSGVENVSWDQAQQFCAWLSKREGRTYRLATNAEWEFAIRGGAEARLWSARGEDRLLLGSHQEMRPFWWGGHFGVHAFNFRGVQPFGGDWVQDRYGPYPSDPQVDPEGPSSWSAFRNYRVMRISEVWDQGREPNDTNGDIRLVCSIDDRFIPPPPVPAREPPPERPVQALASSRLDMGSGQWLELLCIPAGSLTIGRPQVRPEWGTREWPETRVKIPKNYWLGRTEVTQVQFKAVTGLDPSWFKGDDRPVECARFDEIQRFCQILTDRERKAGRLPIDEEFRLPTEAEWECAARAGTDTLYSFGDDPLDLPFYEVVDHLPGTVTVASKRPNPWGFYDMGGNVLEMTWELFGPYPGKDVVDPFERNDHGAGNRMYTSWVAGRGGSWCMGPYAARTTLRRGIHAMSRCHFIGFRLARSQIVKPPEMDELEMLRVRAK